LREIIAKILIVIILSAGGCDLLSTRDSESPITARADFIPASTPDILFNNLVSSFKEKVVENYLACFVDESFLNKKYQYKPGAGAASKFPSLLNWDVESERQYFNNMKAAVQTGVPITLQLFNENNTLQIDSAVYQFDYSITLSTGDASLQGVFQGSVQFIINIDSRNQWVITGWEDIEKNEQTSWSELKGRYY